ncbi:hypothetical protein NIES2101_04290 [Calothrix sp. HK-06]|nr:hypothetical protein NIES2101_04290 [Calothrix sp. HK-06]
MEMFAGIIQRCEIIPYKHQHNCFLLQKLQLINNFATQRGNSYWVDEDFIRGINNLSKPKELPKSFPCGLLMFPSYLCPHDSLGQPVDWVLFEYVKANDAIAPFYIQQNKIEINLNQIIGESIFWATWTQSKLFTGAILALDLSNAILTPNQQSLTKEVAVISRTIGYLLLHSLNAGANPERKLIEAKGFTKNQQHKASEEEPIYLNPKWIGREVKVYHRETARGTHRSPITHQRREYTRQQRCGKGLQEIRSVNVRATVVNKNQEDKPLTLDVCLS